MANLKWDRCEEGARSEIGKDRNFFGRFLVTLGKRKIGHCQSAKVNVHGGVCVRTPIARSGGPLGWWGPGANRSRSPGAAARLRHLLVLDTRSSHARSLTAVAASAHTSHHSSTRLTDRYCIFSCLIFIFNIQFNLDINGFMDHSYGFFLLQLHSGTSRVYTNTCGS